MLVATNWTLKKENFNSSVQASARMEVKRRTVKNQCDSCCYTSETHNARRAAAAAATTPKEKESMKWVRETCPSVSEYNYLDNGGAEGNDGGGGSVGMVVQPQDADSRPRLPQSEAWQKMAATLAICRQQQQ